MTIFLPLRANLSVLLPRKPVISGSLINKKMLTTVGPTVRQGNDSLAFVNGSDKSIGPDPDEFPKEGEPYSSRGGDEGHEESSVDDLRELLQKARRELEVCMLNSTMFEEKAQKVSETALALKDEALSARNDMASVITRIQEVVVEEKYAKEAVQKATMAFSFAEARFHVAVEALEVAKPRCAALVPDGKKIEDEDQKEAACLILCW